jgi:hypothetical protein
MSIGKPQRIVLRCEFGVGDASYSPFFGQSCGPGEVLVGCLKIVLRSEGLGVALLASVGSTRAARTLARDSSRVRQPSPMPCSTTIIDR